MRKAIVHLKKSDRVLCRLIQKVGPYRMEFGEPEFESLVRNIVFQQLSGKVASTIFGRLAAAAANSRLTPASILRLRPARMRAVGLSQQKTTYIRNLAQQTRSGEIDFAILKELSDDEVIARLTRVKGIGIWTAQMFLMFALRRVDVLPSGDFGIRVAVQKAYGLAELPSPAEVERLAQGWHPYCTVASWYLWRSLDSNAAL